MKTIEDLRHLREQLKDAMDVRKEEGIRIIVGMGTCGIAAGARGVMTAILEEIRKRNLTNILVEQTGCIGMCEKEPLVDIVRPGEPRITYGNVTPQLVPRLIAEHVVNGRIVADHVVAKITENA